MYSIANKNYLPSSRHHIILNIICNFISFSGFFEEEFDDYGSFGGGNMGGGGGGFNMRNRRGGGGGGGHPPPMGPMRGGRGSSMMGGGGMGGGGERRGMQPGSCYISKTGHSVHMRGLPFQALEQDVFDVSFF